MNFFKQLGRGLSSGLLKLSLYIFAITFALVSVLGTSQSLQESLRESNVYAITVDEVLDTATQAKQNQASKLPLENPEIRQAAKTAFPAETLEKWSDEVIIGTYDWLDGKTKKPSFEIDVTNQKNAFAKNVADVASKRVESLKACTPRESLQLSQQNIDLFNLPCRPPVNIAGEKQRLISELENSQDIIGDNVINTDDIAPSPQQANQFEDNPLPHMFQWAKRLPNIAIMIGLISTFTLLSLSANKRNGFKKIGFTFFGSSVFLAINTLLFNYLFNQADRPDGPLSKLPGMKTAGLQNSLIEVIKSLFGSINTKIIFVAAIYLVIGTGILLTLRFTRQRSDPSLAPKI